MWHPVHCTQAASTACHEVTWYPAEHMWACGLALSAGNAADTQPGGRFTGSGMTLRRAAGNAQNRLKFICIVHEQHSLGDFCSLGLNHTQQQLPCAKISVNRMLPHEADTWISNAARCQDSLSVGFHSVMQWKRLP